MKVLDFFVCHPVLFGQGIHKRIDQMCCFVVATVSGQLKSIKKEKKMKEILTMKHSPTCHRLRKQRLNIREVHLKAHGRPKLESGKLDSVSFPFFGLCCFFSLDFTSPYNFARATWTRPESLPHRAPPPACLASLGGRLQAGEEGKKHYYNS